MTGAEAVQGKVCRFIYDAVPIREVVVVADTEEEVMELPDDPPPKQLQDAKISSMLAKGTALLSLPPSLIQPIPAPRAPLQESRTHMHAGQHTHTRSRHRVKKPFSGHQALFVIMFFRWQ